LDLQGIERPGLDIPRFFDHPVEIVLGIHLMARQGSGLQIAARTHGQDGSPVIAYLEGHFERAPPRPDVTLCEGPKEAHHTRVVGHQIDRSQRELDVSVTTATFTKRRACRPTSPPVVPKRDMPSSRSSSSSQLRGRYT
jgi:hypothetical protein